MFLDKAKLKQAFSNASTTYDSVAQLQRDVGWELLAAVDKTNITGTLLDIGCGTGFLTRELLALSGYQQIIALDIAFAMLKTTQQKLAGQTPVHYLCANAECLPLAAQSVDVVFSNLALQWCNPLDMALQEIKRVLKIGGQLHFSTFGTQTLNELKHAWAQVDRYSHVNDFYSENHIKQDLQNAGFRQISTINICYQPYYDSVQALMRELKQLGAHNVLEGRNKRITTKSAMQQMIAAYQPNTLGHQIPATFEVILVSTTL